MSDLEELPRQLAELRGLIREGHGVIKDMNRLLREYRNAAADAAGQARQAAAEAASEEMTRASRHIQAEMNRHAKDLNRAVQAARVQVVKALTVRTLDAGPDGGGLTATFAGNLFDDDVPLPGAGNGERSRT